MSITAIYLDFICVITLNRLKNILLHHLCYTVAELPSEELLATTSEVPILPPDLREKDFPTCPTYTCRVNCARRGVSTSHRTFLFFS